MPTNNKDRQAVYPIPEITEGKYLGWTWRWCPGNVYPRGGGGHIYRTDYTSPDGKPYSWGFLVGAHIDGTPNTPIYNTLEERVQAEIRKHIQKEFSTGQGE